MTGTSVPDLARRREALLQARDAIERELAEIEAGTPAKPPGWAQDGRKGPDACEVPLKRAAGTWGVSYEAARLRALRLEPLGLAVKLRPGGWRVSVEALG